MKRKCALATAILLLIASALSVGAFALSLRETMFSADLSHGSFQVDYTCEVNAEYALYLFSRDGGEVSAHAELYEGDELIAQGDGRGELFSCRLAAGTDYTIRVSGSGQALIELARSALGRCWGAPLEISDHYSGGKMIAHAYDAHWYCFTAEESGRIAVRAVPEEDNLYLSGVLLDEDGGLIQYFDRLNTACLVRADVEAGKKYYVRLCAGEGGAGYYKMDILSLTGESTVAFSEDTYSADAGSRINLAEHVSGSALLWAVDDASLARVSQSGTLLALREGTVRVTAYGAVGEASCDVKISFVPLEDILPISDSISLCAGDTASIELEFVPENASDIRVSFAPEDPIVEIDDLGAVHALCEGETDVTITDSSGMIRKTVHISVMPAPIRYRALLVSQQNYPESVNTVRSGSEDSVRALEKLLGTMRFESSAYVTRTGYDLSRAEFVSALRETFAEATEQDVSLLYLTCHGHCSGGMTYFEFTDGSQMTARELERELRAVRGHILVLLDCCGSGGVLFDPAAIRASGYLVICSAAPDQDSYRISFDANGQSGTMVTAFARALCDGAGWDIEGDAAASMDADRDYDGCVTASELCLYIKSRVNWYLSVASLLTDSDYTQSVQTNCEGDSLILFRRKDT